MSSNWDSEKIYFDSDSYFHDLCEDIQRAKLSIDLEFYIFLYDSLGQRISERLIEASNRGVRIRVIVDGFGSPLWRYFFEKKYLHAGIQSRIFHRIPLRIIFLFPVLFPFIKKFLLQIQRRNHRKLCIVDKKIAWTGSMNIAAYHLREFQGINAWRDTGVRVTGDDVSLLSIAFQATWKSKLFTKKINQKLSPLVRIYNTRKSQKKLYEDFLKKLGTAEKRIWISTAYFVPPRSLLKTLQKASARKVDVRILTSGKTDIFLFRWIRDAFYLGLLNCGVKIFEYQPSILHAKSALMDEISIIGSTNLNTRSLFHNLEIDIVLTKKLSIESMEKQFLLDIDNSHEIQIEDWKNRPYSDRILCKFALLFKYWL